jgi:3-methylcrotonyl-CoA carboxylase beta subunit
VASSHRGPERSEREATIPPAPPEELYDILPDDHRQPYEMHEVLDCILDGDELDEFQPDHARR